MKADRLIAQLAKWLRPALRLLAAIILVAGTATVGERIANDDSRPVVNTGGPVAVSNAVHGAFGDLAPAPSVRAIAIDASSIAAPLTLLLAVAAFPLIGRRQRRVGDVGDAWRSLLLGAPPAAL
jgi:hypothetical protein